MMGSKLNNDKTDDPIFLSERIEERFHFSLTFHYSPSIWYCKVSGFRFIQQKFVNIKSDASRWVSDDAYLYLDYIPILKQQ